MVQAHDNVDDPQLGDDLHRMGMDGGICHVRRGELSAFLLTAVLRLPCWPDDHQAVAAL
jgi:hypothetical protein